MSLPETILQFGSGRFLRAFFDLFVHHANEAGQGIGRVVIVQSTGAARAGGLNRQAGKYHVVVRGVEAGETIDRVEECASVSRALHAGTEWDEVLKLARSADLKAVVSNTTEAGFALDPADRAKDAPPRSFPAKLLGVLKARWEAALPPVPVIPCELIEGNALHLREALAKLVSDWDLPNGFAAYLARTPFLHTLVDRIVTGPPAGHPLTESDPMLVTAEPFAFFALEDHPDFRLEHPAVVRPADVTPYFLRKVRILNAAHTALLIKAVPLGYELVREAVADAELSAWLRRLLFDEIVPTLAGRVDRGEWFAEQTLERFANPFLDHKFSDIALHHASKVKVRLVPTRDEYRAAFGREPKLLGEVLAAG